MLDQIQGAVRLGHLTVLVCVIPTERIIVASGGSSEGMMISLGGPMRNLDDRGVKWWA